MRSTSRSIRSVSSAEKLTPGDRKVRRPALDGVSCRRVLTYPNKRADAPSARAMMSRHAADSETSRPDEGVRAMLKLAGVMG